MLKNKCCQLNGRKPQWV